jgi:hypothetical protein
LIALDALVADQRGRALSMIRRGAAGILWALAIVLGVVLDEPWLGLIPLVGACLLMRGIRPAPKRRLISARREWVAVLVFVALTAATLALHNGPLRTVAVVLIIAGYIATWWFYLTRPATSADCSR